MAEELTPELGDFVTIVSQTYGTTTGRIVLRDETLLRVKPVHEQIVQNFPIGEDGMFQENLGITSLLIKEKRKDPHFAIQMNVVVGDEIDMFDPQGQPLGTAGKVEEILATEDMDAIRLDNGKYLNFQFVGPKPAIGFLVARTTEEPDEEIVDTDDVAPEYVFNPDLIPYEEEANEQFTYSDSTQRQDMFTAFMEDIPTKRQKDPNVSASIYRMTDVFLALKNSVVVRDSTGAVRIGAEPRSYVVQTVQESLEKQRQGVLSALLPIANVKKVLYVDDFDPATEPDDVVFQSDVEGIYRCLNLSNQFEQSTKKEAGFIPYIYSMFQTLRTYESKRETDLYVEVDQDVLRSAVPPTKIDGFPVLPPLDAKGGPTLINDSFVGKIDTQYTRIIGPSRITLSQTVDKKTTDIVYAVAPADTADVVDQILLSQELLSFRQPYRSSVLLWDVMASEQSRRRMQTFFQTLTSLWEKQRLLGEIDSLQDILASRLHSTLNFLHPHNLQMLDAFGLRNLELSHDVFQLLLTNIEHGISDWNDAFPKLAEQAQRDLERPHKPVFSNIVALDSPLFPMTNSIFKGLADVFQGRYKYSVLAKADLAFVEDIWSAYTTGILWYAMISGKPSAVFPYAVSDYAGEVERTTSLTESRRELARRFVASPTINPCRHVKNLDFIRRIKDDAARMNRFQGFLRTFHGGRMGQFVRCNVCSLELCCMHEVMLLNEFQHIGNQDVLHKELLLEFAGPAFEGSYICKVCGQKIRDIEYDTSIEFDDDGKPLVGRSVVEPDDEDVLGIGLQEESEEKQSGFQGEDFVLYTELLACFQACGMEVSVQKDRELCVRCVDALRTFRAYLPTEEKYEGGRKGQLAAMKGEKKRKEFERQFPPYSQYIANAMVGCIGALAILEFQTGSISVPDPARGCAFSLAGVPLEDTGDGCLNYVICVLVSANLAGVLYRAASWGLDTNPKRKTEDIQIAVIFALDVLMQKKKATALVTVTEIYKARLAETRRSILEDLPSHFDTLPPGYRPMTELPKNMPIDAVKNVAVFQSSLSREPFDVVAPIVTKRQLQLDDTILAIMHASAKKDTVANTNNPRSDGTGSFQRLSLVALNGRGYKSTDLDSPVKQEIELMVASQAFLRKKDPAKSANGTHIHVPWSAPTGIVPVPELDTSILYKLFLKHCFRGSYEGFVHELGPDYICRRCGFSYPIDLVYLTSSEIAEKDPKKMEGALTKLGHTRETILLGRFQEQGLTINEATFVALDEKVRYRKILPNYARNHGQDLFSVLDSLDAYFPGEDWTTITTTLRRLKEKKIVEEIDRTVELGIVSTMYDTRLEESKKTWTSFGGKGAADKVLLAENGLLQATEHPYTATRNVTNMFAVQAGQIVASTPNVRPNARKWFASINPNHLQELEDIWANAASVVTKTIQTVTDAETDTADNVLEILTNIRDQFGHIMKLWSVVRPSSDLLPNEYTLVVRWMILTLLHNLLLNVNGQEATILYRWLLDTLVSMSQTASKYQRSDEQIQLDIAEREERERNYFIGKFNVLEGEMRKIELMKKKLGLGDWNVSAKNLFQYNSDWWEHDREQRAAMGLLPEFAGLGQEEQMVAAPVNPFRDENDHRVAEDEDA